MLVSSMKGQISGAVEHHCGGCWGQGQPSPLCGAGASTAQLMPCYSTKRRYGCRTGTPTPKTNGHRRSSVFHGPIHQARSGCFSSCQLDASSSSSSSFLNPRLPVTMPLAKPANTDAHVTSQFSLKGKTAVVTGGVRGIGLAASRGLAEAGANVAVLYSSTKDADAIADSIAADTGVKVKAYKAAVENKDEITRVINTVAADFGGLDIVVANAGIANHHPAEDYTEQEWRHIMAVNLDGAFYTAQAAGVIFKAQGHGNVIFTASVSAMLVNLPQKQAAYNASKAGVVQLARCLSVEWVDFARVNCISPGFIATDMLDVHPREWREKWLDMVPGKRLCDTGELKGAYVFLASDASSYMSKFPFRCFAPSTFFSFCSACAWHQASRQRELTCWQRERIWLSTGVTHYRSLDWIAVAAVKMSITRFLHARQSPWSPRRLHNLCSCILLQKGKSCYMLMRWHFSYAYDSPPTRHGEPSNHEREAGPNIADPSPSFFSSPTHTQAHAETPWKGHRQTGTKTRGQGNYKREDCVRQGEADSPKEGSTCRDAKPPHYLTQTPSHRQELRSVSLSTLSPPPSLFRSIQQIPMATFAPEQPTTPTTYNLQSNTTRSNPDSGASSPYDP